MNERGTYGNGHGYSSLTAGNEYTAYGQSYGYPALGADISSAVKRELPTAFMRFFMMVGGALAGRAVSEAGQSKGIVLGAVGGFVASILMEQTAELKSIAADTQSLRLSQFR